MTFIWLQITSLIYISILIGVYFSKKRLKNLENNLFIYMMIANAVGLILEIFCYFTLMYIIKIPVINFMTTRILLGYFLLWIVIFSIYIFIISIKINKEDDPVGYGKYVKSVKLHFIVVFFAALVICWCLPLEYNLDPNYYYSYGSAVEFLNVIYAVLIFIWIIKLLKNYKNIKSQKYLPIFIFIVLGTVISILQKVKPELLIITSCETIIVYLMYFTIENPDMRMIFELSKTKEIMEDAIADKTNFTQKVTSSVKDPINEISSICDNVLNDKDIEDVKEGIRQIRAKTHEVDAIIYGTLKISSNDVKILNFTKEQYNPIAIINEVVLRIKSKIPEGVEFKTDISSGLPSLVYGDKVKFKQCLMNTLLNSIKYTSEGYIKLTIECLIENDICRLIITTEDTGSGMDIVKINDIIDDKSELTPEDRQRLDTLDVGLKSTNKILKVIGGTLTIKSNPGCGTTVRVAFDSPIYHDEKSKDEKEIEKMEKTVFSQKKVAIVSDQDFVAKEASKFAHSVGFEYKLFKSSLDCLNRYRQGNKCDYVFIQEDMSKIDGYELLSKLKSIENFNAKFILMTKHNDNVSKQKYKEDGFDDSISIPTTEDELRLIIR